MPEYTTNEYAQKKSYRQGQCKMGNKPTQKADKQNENFYAKSQKVAQE